MPDPLSRFQSGEVSNLYTMRPDGSDSEELTSYRDDSERASHPRFTPDGTRISSVTDTGTARESGLHEVLARPDPWEPERSGEEVARRGRSAVPPPRAAAC